MTTRGAVLFVAGLITGVGLASTAAEDRRLPGMNGVNHLAFVTKLRERGLTVGDPRVIGSGSLTVSITDPDGNRIEVSELPPGSPARKAIEGWK